ncbi:MAG: hypothetical protein IID18_08600 [Nitrospinae bacterium]|nr:hypothetical protein [Nitrospinota bacterium]
MKTKLGLKSPFLKETFALVPSTSVSKKFNIHKYKPDKVEPLVTQHFPKHKT